MSGTGLRADGHGCRHECALIDSIIARTHQHPVGTLKKRDAHAIFLARGGRSTKIHVAADALGHPTSMHFTAGHPSDQEGAYAMLGSLPASTVIAKKEHNAEEGVLVRLEQSVKPPSHPT